ncbi:MAG: hypothetical protein JW900_02545 [Anaerolineae bacterium]|nr:hypothetical protein [Anaerolineae bacterium]
MYIVSIIDLLKIARRPWGRRVCNVSDSLDLGCDVSYVACSQRLGQPPLDVFLPWASSLSRDV